LSREEFLHSAAVRASITEITGPSDQRVLRAFELVNKTNQFNTTGKRWKWEECVDFLASGGRMYTFGVTDRYTDYGIVGVILVRAGHIEQWVMSCRILGYDVEKAVMSVLVRTMRESGVSLVTGGLTETEVNFPCRDLFVKCGFDRVGDQWALAEGRTVEAPLHVEIPESRALAA
jgi:FkbH-like protein